MSIRLTVKIPEPSPFKGEKEQAKSWLNKLKRYFIAVGLDLAVDTLRANAIAQALMDGNAAKWLDRLVVSNEEPVDFSDFEHKFLK